MKKLSKQTVTVLIILACVAVVVGIKAYQHVQGRPVYDSVAARSKGNPGAGFKIIEYVDFQCPACAHGSKILSQYHKNHPEDLYIEIKYFPLNGHRHSFRAARYAECAARQGQFWPFHDLVFERQSLWKRLISAESAFQQITKDIGLDPKSLDICLKDESIDELILEDKAKGKSLQVKSTPSYFINGKLQVGTRGLRTELMTHFRPKSE